MSTIAVIGAGISGLTAAYRLQREGHTVTVWEATDQVGGVIQSESSDGFLVEHGPNSLRASTPALGALIADLGLSDAVVSANEEAATRYVVRDGRPLPLPMSVPDFLTTDLFSARAKWRLLAEPFISRRADEEESVASFVRRRLGPEVLDYAVAPFVGGVFAGRPQDLSITHAFERLADLESDHGSLLWGGLRAALSGSSTDNDGPSGLFSFRHGIDTLPAALADRLQSRIHLNTPVRGLSRPDDQWCLHLADGPAPESFDAVVSTVPLHRFATLDLDTPVDRTPLDKVEYPPLRVVALGYERDAIAHSLDGFGLLVPPVEDFDSLGTIFSSTLFPNRAPEGHALLTTFVGGARAPDLAQQPEATLQQRVEADLDRLLGVSAPPVFARQIHWSQAIPQYTLGYGAVKRTLDALEDAHPGLVFAGNYRQGVSVGDAVASGADAATRVAAQTGP